MPDCLPAGAMRTRPVSVWSVDALDRFVCWMTYARLFEHIDLLGAWVDSAEQFSLVLWDRRAAVALGCTVTASEWADPAGQSPEWILAEVVARTQTTPSGSKDAVGIVWDRESELRRLPWEVLPRPGVAQSGAASGASGVLDGSSIEDGEATFTEAVRELRYEYHGAFWASTMLWRMIDGYRVHWAADLRLLAGWVSVADEFTIILHATETEYEEPHRTELVRLLLPGQHTPRVGKRLRRVGDDPRPWRNDHLIAVSDDLAELTAATPTSGLAREWPVGSPVWTDAPSGSGCVPPTRHRRTRGRTFIATYLTAELSGPVCRRSWSMRTDECGLYRQPQTLQSATVSSATRRFRHNSRLFLSHSSHLPLLSHQCGTRVGGKPIAEPYGKLCAEMTGEGDVTPISGGELSGMKFLTVAEVAALMRVSKMSVYRLIHNGHLEAVRFGRSFRVSEEAVHAYLRSSFYETG